MLNICYYFRFSKEQIRQRLSDPEQFGCGDVIQRISRTDVLVIDEISMLSAKIFEQIEITFRFVKGNSAPFGGTQIILCGDFYQLKPVPNDLYRYDGNYCFTSELFQTLKCHHIQLYTVHRQEEVQLIKAVSQLCRGGSTITADTKDLLVELSRDMLDGDRPVELFALNYDVSICNSKHLMSLPGVHRSKLRV